MRTSENGLKSSNFLLTRLSEFCYDKGNLYREALRHADDKFQTSVDPRIQTSIRN